MADSSALGQTPRPPGMDMDQLHSWLENRLKFLYFQSRESPSDTGAPTLDTRSYMDHYSAVHDYCTTSKSSNRETSHRGAHLRGEDLYRMLEREIRAHCREIKSEMLPTDADPKTAITTHMAQWEKFNKVADFIGRLFKFVDRHWIMRERDEGRQDVYTITGLHALMWKEEVLQIDQELVDLRPGSWESLGDSNELVRTAVKLESDGGDDAKELVERFRSSLEYIRDVSRKADLPPRGDQEQS